MSICEAQLSLLKQLLNETKIETAAVERLSNNRNDSMRHAEVIDRKGFLGPLLIGSFLEIVLFGILVMQIQNYHLRFPRDPVLLKVVAWLSFLGSLALTIAIFADSWYRFIVSSVMIVRDSMIPSSELATIVIAVLGLLSQVFFAWRIQEMSRKRWLQVLVCCLAVMQFTAFIVVNVHSMVIQLPNDNQYDFINSPSLTSSWIKDPSTFIWMGTSIACDLTITVSMVILLGPALKEAAFGQTRPMLSRILKLTFETGILSVILAIVMTGLLFSKAPSTQYTRLIVFYPSGVLYSTWLLVALSARPSGGTGKQTITTTRVQSTHFGDLRFGTNTTQQQEITINITTTVHGDGIDADEASVEAPGEKQTTKPKAELVYA